MDYKVRNIYGRTTEDMTMVRVPGSKSITARALLLAAVADGESVLRGAQFSDDCLTFLNCLKDLGISCDVQGDVIRIQGCGGKLGKREASIYVGSAGTAARFLPAFLAFQDGRYELHASEQMERRPILSLLKSLETLGAKITYLEQEGRYPFVIQGTAAPAGTVDVEIGESSQFLSGLLIASACAGSAMQIRFSGTHGLDYVKMTVSMMRSFGADVQESENSYIVSGSCRAREYDIEPDMSAAAYFYAANRILGTHICVQGACVQGAEKAFLQGDSRFIQLLPGFDGGRIDMSAMSDQALTLAAIAPYFSKPTEICGIGHIRMQECDRIHAICRNLDAMGIRTEEREDSVTVFPGQPQTAVIDTYGDHRVAMSFAITGLRADGIVIQNAQVCSKTFKDFFTVLDELCDRLTAK